MKKKRIIVIITLSVIFFSGVIGCLMVYGNNGGNIVSIRSDGKEVYSIDLDNADDCTFTIEYNGRKNVIEIKDHAIRVTEADCPDGICVKTPAIEAGKGSAPIVCLPNRLVIEKKDSDPDGISR